MRLIFETRMDDESLERIRNGDEAAFTAMVRRYEHAMLCTSFRILGQQADAEEVRQCVLLGIWKEPRNLPSAKRFSAWLHRCVVNESIKRIRIRKRQHHRNSILAQDLPHSADELQDHEFEEVREAMAKLAPEQRAILSLKFDEQLTVREIGRVLESPHTTVQSKLTKAIDDLRSLIQDLSKN